MVGTSVASQVGCYQLGSKKEPLPPYKPCIYLVATYFHRYLHIYRGPTSNKMGSPGETTH
jgi:hypothetical protein